jgi:ComF family protein
MGELARGALELVFPERCASCGVAIEEGASLCALCAESLDCPGPFACSRCGEPQPPPGPLAAAIAEARAGQPPTIVCSRCRAVPPAFARAQAPYLYGGALATAIGRLKFAGLRELAAPLGRTLAPALIEVVANVEPPAMIVAVPLHPRRLRAREFNQALLLARAAAAAVRAAGGHTPPLDPTALRRTIDTLPQIGLPPPKRAANVRRAFRASARVAGYDVVLVDDVLTTGATANACARALMEAGARRVVVLTLARAAP